MDPINTATMDEDYEEAFGELYVKEKPLLLVDVDGCLNAFGWVWGQKKPKAEGLPNLEKQFKCDGFPIRVPEGTEDRMTRLEVLFEPWWCTTWEKDAPRKLADRFGFGKHWPVIELGQPGWGYVTWKLPFVIKWDVGSIRSRPLAWIDDDLSDDAFTWAEQRENTLLIRPEASIGFTEDNCLQLEAFAQAK